MRIIVTEIDLTDQGTHHCCHEIVDVSAYRDILSANAFFWSVKNYCYSKTRLFYGQREHEWEISNKTRKMNEIRRPTIIHPSLWDFYKFIGYDYKKKKFI